MTTTTTAGQACSAETIPKPRKIPFQFPEDLDPQWIPGEPELVAMLNGASLTMPYLEPFLIRTMRAAVDQLREGDLKEQGRAFNTQEQHHFQAHRRFNALLKRKRYPELEAIEEQMKASYARLSRRSLRVRMAYTAGFESMTLGVTKWLIEERVKLFAGADSRAVSFVLWHMVEETEHKRVAYDVYCALYKPSFMNGLARMLGVFHGSFDVMRFAMRGYGVILRKEGLWRSFRSRMRLAGWMWAFVSYVFPFLFRAALPGHNPRRERDPQWVTDWLEGYALADPDVPPLVDTHHPKMPVPFPTAAKASRLAS